MRPPYSSGGPNLREAPGRLKRDPHHAEIMEGHYFQMRFGIVVLSVR